MLVSERRDSYEPVDDGDIEIGIRKEVILLNGDCEHEIPRVQRDKRWVIVEYFVTLRSDIL